MNLNVYLSQYQARLKSGGNSAQRMRSEYQNPPPRLDFLYYSGSSQRKVPSLNLEKLNRKKLKIKMKELSERLKETVRETPEEEQSWRQQVIEIQKQSTKSKI